MQQGKISRRRLFAAGAIGLAVACAPAAGTAETHVVEMRGLEFFPAEIDAAVGDTVTWVNADVTPHTATARNGAWDSGSMQRGDQWSLVIDSAGRIDYVCTFHPTMVGALNAQ